MRVRVTPHYVQLVYEACLKSFWRRKRLAQFLRACSVPQQYLATWSNDETKRDLLDRLFDDLPKSQGGRRIIVMLARNLLEQTSFPDLENWEDSENKIRQARKAVARLRAHQRVQEEEIQTTEDREATHARFREHQERVARAQTSLQNLSDRLDKLLLRLGSQQAGYDFQDWFHDLADFAEVTNKRPYVVGGRQIDGSLTVSGTTYLVELKFTNGQADSSDIDTFYKKVTSKADNTMGVMLSISGYSSVAMAEASGQRTPLLLLDHGHVFLILRGVMSLNEVINRVRRHASQTGKAYLSADA